MKNKIIQMPFHLGITFLFLLFAGQTRAQGVAVQGIVQNNTASPISIYWADQQGQNQPYFEAPIPPGGQLAFQSYPGTTWRAYSGQTFLKEYVSTVQNGQNFVVGEQNGKPGRASLTIPAITHSPDGRYGVEVPESFDTYQEGAHQNSIVEVKTGRVLAVIPAETGLENMNHGGIKATWSNDSSVLLWEVAGKWFPRALRLIKLEGGAVKWQVDLLTTAQQEMLNRTRQASPASYAAVVAYNEGKMGSGYPEGFTINVERNAEDGDTPITIPLSVQANLTANPKPMDSFPEDATVESEMEVEIDSQGAFQVKKFQLLN